MATIKSYTDLEQSRKLAEILPLESADMCYVIDYAESNKYGTDHFNLEVDTYGFKVQTRDNIPCWSLAALLNVLPAHTLQTNTDGSVFVVCESTKPVISNAYDNPIDACVEMIKCLHELSLL